MKLSPVFRGSNPPGVWEVMGSIPFGTQNFSLFHASVMLSISLLSMELVRNTNSQFSNCFTDQVKLLYFFHKIENLICGCISVFFRENDYRKLFRRWGPWIFREGKTRINSSCDRYVIQNMNTYFPWTYHFVFVYFFLELEKRNSSRGNSRHSPVA